MATDKRKLTKRKKEIILYVLLTIIIIIFAIWYYYKYYYVVESVNPPIILEEEDNTLEESTTIDVDGVLHVHMIDCGQADSFLFEQNGGTKTKKLLKGIQEKPPPLFQEMEFLTQAVGDFVLQDFNPTSVGQESQQAAGSSLPAFGDDGPAAAAVHDIE